MKARNLILILAAVAMAVGATVVLAGPGGFGPPGMHGRGMGGPLGPLGRALHRLDLSDAQRTQIDAIVTEAKPGIEALREQLRSGREAFRAAHPPTTFDEAAIRAHATEQGKIRTELAVSTAGVRAQVLGVLTADQLARLKAIREEMNRRGGPGRDRRPGGPWR